MRQMAAPGPSLSVFACLATTAVALQPSATPWAGARVPRSRQLATMLQPSATPWAGARVPRSRQLLATMRDLPPGWTTGFDQANQATYYVNEQTGQSQWDPPQPQGGGYY